MKPSDLKMTASNLTRTETSGRVRHDDRGAAVWDWEVETGELEALTASAVMRRLDVAELKVQEAPRLALSIAGRDAGGGGDPYNSRCDEGRPTAMRRSRVR